MWVHSKKKDDLLSLMILLQNQPPGLLPTVAWYGGRTVDGGTDVFDRRLVLGAQSRTDRQAADACSQALATAHRIHPGFLRRTQLALPSSVRDSGAMLKLIPRI